MEEETASVVSHPPGREVGCPLGGKPRLSDVRLARVYLPWQRGCEVFAEVPALLCHETRERETVGQADAHAEGTAVGLAVFVRLTQHEGTQVACPWPCERMASTSAEHLAGFEEGISSFPANAEHVVDGGKRLKRAYSCTELYHGTWSWTAVLST